MYKKNKIVILIPAYNTEKEINDVFRELKENKRYFDEIIILDDGSTDSTFHKILSIKKLWKYQEKITILKHKNNLGYGAAQKRLFESFLKHEGDIGILIHADNQYPPKYIKHIVRSIISNKNDIVLGSRFFDNLRYYYQMPVYKIIGNKLLTKLENKILGSNLTEFHTGLRGYSRKAINTINFNEFSDFFIFDSEILFQAHEKGLQIGEIPVYAKYGEIISHLSSVKYGIRIILLCFRYLLRKIVNFKKNRSR